MSIGVFDLHCDTADRLAWGSLSDDLHAATGLNYYGPGDEDAPDEAAHLVHNHCHISLEKIGDVPWTQCMACFIPDSLNPEQALRFYTHVSSYLSHEIELARAAGFAVVDGRNARSNADNECNVDSCNAGGQTQNCNLTIVRTIENARLFAHDLALVEKLSHEGVVMASLSWNAAGPLASGFESHEGLSLLGKEALREMERCNMVVDVSHLNDEGFADVVAHSEKPFVASHSNARAICNHPRNLTDAQFAEIVARKGLVGLNFCSYFLEEGKRGVLAPTVSFDQMAAHIEHWLDRGGEDIVALGSDWDGCDTPDVVRDASCMKDFQALLMARFGENITRKLCFENAEAFFNRTCC